MDIIRGKVKWIDLVRPSEGDLQWLRKQYKFHPVIIEELKELSARARVESYGDYLYLIHQFPIYDEVEKVSRRTEIDVLITKKDLITVRYEENAAFDHFKSRMLSKEFKNKAMQSTLQLTYQLIDTTLSFNQRQLHHIRQKVEHIAEELFKDREKEVLRDVSYVKRDLSEYRIIFEPQGELLRSLVENGAVFWGAASKPYLSALVGDHLKLMSELEGYRAAIVDFESTNNQIMNMKSTDATKTFTILAFFTFPLVLVAGIFGMNTRDMPLVTHPQGFWIILGMMACLTVALYVYFRSKKWL